MSLSLIVTTCDNNMVLMHNWCNNNDKQRSIINYGDLRLQPHRPSRNCRRPRDALWWCFEEQGIAETLPTDHLYWALIHIISWLEVPGISQAMSISLPVDVANRICRQFQEKNLQSFWANLSHFPFRIMFIVCSSHLVVHADYYVIAKSQYSRWCIFSHFL